MGKKRLQYDDGALVEMIAEGQLTYAMIGQKLGISASLVKKIAMGVKRRELSRPLWDAEDGILSEARRVGSRFARNLIMEQVRLGLHGKGDQARRAREFVLKFVTTSRPKRSDLPRVAQPPRPEWVQETERQMGLVPWEEQEAAAREAEAIEEERLAAQSAPVSSSMAAQSVLPGGVGQPTSGGL